MMKTRTRLAMAGSAAILAVALSGCSVIDGILGGKGDAPRDEESGQVTESSNIDIFSLKVGDCKMASGTGMIEDTDVVPCDQPHDEEVFFEFKVDDGEFDDAAITAAAETQCYGQPFTDFVGLDYNSSSLDAAYISPSKDTWEQLNDRVVQCIIADPAGQTTGSLKGSAR